MVKKPFCIGFGLATKDTQGQWLETYFHQPVFHPDQELFALCSKLLKISQGSCQPSRETWQQLKTELAKFGAAELSELVGQLASQQNTVAVLLEEDNSPADVPQIYLKLQLISRRLVKPHEVVLDGLFGLLPNVVWTNKGAIANEDFPQQHLTCRLEGSHLHVYSVDKFPPLTDYVIPSGVRIADSARVRLGAYLGEGTTVMHEGFINFNAGTLGSAMVEGRISAGVTIGDKSDLGGGASTMGTLSGGGSELISVGRNCLIGANAGIGISLGDRCTVEAGLYVTAGSIVTLKEDNGAVRTMKARELSGKDDLLFIRHSVTGAIECRSNNKAVTLNQLLHGHN